MGRDGAAGLLSMRKAGARTYGQNESTCIVYGMPKAAFDLGAVEKQLSLDRLAAAIMSETSTIKKH
jgi:two-component system chemotaxis response regulator CheB